MDNIYIEADNYIQFFSASPKVISAGFVLHVSTTQIYNYDFVKTGPMEHQ